jgi:hypothetical protein
MDYGDRATEWIDGRQRTGPLWTEDAITFAASRTWPLKNEGLLKLLCHNVVVVHQAIIELGIEGAVWPEKPDERREVLPMRHA